MQEVVRRVFGVHTFGGVALLKRRAKGFMPATVSGEKVLSFGVEGIPKEG